MGKIYYIILISYERDVADVGATYNRTKKRFLIFFYPQHFLSLLSFCIL